MSEVVYSTNLELEGPWMLDRAALCELDEILKKIHDQLAERVEQKVESDLDEYLRLRNPEDNDYEGSKQNKKEYLENIHKLEAYVGFGVSKNKKIVDKTIENILITPEFSDESPVSFEAKYELHTDGFKQIQVELNSGYSIRPRLSITLFPSTDHLIREAYAELKTWAQKHEPSLLLKMWAKARFVAWFIWGQLVVFTLIAYASVLSAELQYENKAKVLLENGLSDEEALEALELVLRDQYNIPYVEPTQIDFSPGWWELALLVGLVICLIVTVRPPLILGVGKDEKKLRHWKGWIKFVSVGLPLFLLTSVIVPLVLKNI
jgi:hypothetical protein